MKKGRKAQMKMFESVAVLVVFFFLLVFGVSFYFTLQKSSLQREVERIGQLAAIQQALKLTFLPELDCSFASVQKENCFDRFKVESFATILDDPRTKIDYFDIFGYSTVTLKTIYSSIGIEPPIPIYDRAAEGSYIATQIPVLICENGCDPLNPEYSFGLLEVNSYVPS